MRNLKIRLTSALACGMLALLPTLQAGTPELAASANWAVHFNYAAFSKSDLGAALEQRQKSENEKKALDLAVSLLGFNPHRDLKSLTVFGPDKERENAVMIARGNFDTDRVTLYLEQRGSFTAIPHGAHRILYWGDDAKRTELFSKAGALAFHDSQRVVMAASPEQVKQTLDLLDGNEETRSLPIPADMGTPYMVAFGDLSALGNFRPEAALLRQADRLLMAVNEVDGKVETQLLLEARDLESARQIEAVIQGIQAYALLRSTGDWAGLPAWLLTATVIRNDQTLHLYLDVPVEEIFKFIDKQWETR